MKLPEQRVRRLFALGVALIAGVASNLTYSPKVFAASAPQETRPGVNIQITGANTQVFKADPAKGCGPTDIPDGPARAVRLADGTILMMASSAENFPFRGKSIETMQKSCQALFHGQENDDPRAFNDRSWLLTPFSLDGTHILGLIHNEFQGHRRAQLCPNGKYVSCWYNSVTGVISNDGGKTFARPTEGSFLVAAPRYRYDETVGSQAGYFNPTNIVPYKGSGSFAFLLYTPHVKDQEAGTCVLSSRTPLEFGSWRAYDGTEFTVDLSTSPYQVRPKARPKPCAPVSQRVLRWPVTSIVLHCNSGNYIALMVGSDLSMGRGSFYATSQDLIHWDGPAKLLDASLPSSFHCGEPVPHLYPSILSPIG